MKNFILLILLFVIGGIAKAGTDKSLSEPPFWMSSYDEFNDLQDQQKKFYLQHLEPELTKVPALRDLSSRDLRQAANWYKSWDQIRNKLYKYCESNDAKKTCEGIADVRLKALDLMANQSKVNRDSAE